MATGRGRRQGPASLLLSVGGQRCGRLPPPLVGRRLRVLDRFWFCGRFSVGLGLSLAGYAIMVRPDLGLTLGALRACNVLSLSGGLLLGPDLGLAGAGRLGLHLGLSDGLRAGIRLGLGRSRLLRPHLGLPLQALGARDILRLSGGLLLGP